VTDHGLDRESGDGLGEERKEMGVVKSERGHGGCRREDRLQLPSSAPREEQNDSPETAVPLTRPSPSLGPITTFSIPCSLRASGASIISGLPRMEVTTLMSG
jgi:hypothetical protein